LNCGPHIEQVGENARNESAYSVTQVALVLHVSGPRVGRLRSFKQFGFEEVKFFEMSGQLLAA
jgi:hypothetical protein